MKTQTQKYFEGISRLEQRIEQLKYELAELERNRVEITALNYEHCGSGGRKNEAAFEKTADKIVDLKLEINREIEDLIAARSDAIHLIQRLDDSCQEKVLFMRYIKRMTFDEIVDSVGISRSQIYNIHKTAFLNLEKLAEK